MAPVRDHSGKTIFVEPIYYAPYTRTIVALPYSAIETAVSGE